VGGTICYFRADFETHTFMRALTVNNSITIQIGLTTRIENVVLHLVLSFNVYSGRPTLM
jgi:hypothetical protein